MAAKARTNPRKSASQERSRLTVDALIEATARILVKQGYDHASTNRIAQAAGVSIGSLYQYFPSKEALVAAVIDRHNQAMMLLVREALARVSAQPPATAVRTLVKVMIDAHRVNPRLHRALFEQVPRVGRLDNIQANDREAAALVKLYLDAICGRAEPYRPSCVACLIASSTWLRRVRSRRISAGRTTMLPAASLSA